MIHLRNFIAFKCALLRATAGAVLLAAAGATAQAQTADPVPSAPSSDNPSSPQSNNPSGAPAADPSKPVQLLPKTLQPDQKPKTPAQPDGNTTANPESPPTEPFEIWLEKVKAEAKAIGISDAVIEQAFKGVEVNDDVIDLDNRQPEFTTPVWEYIQKQTKPDAISRGRAHIILKKKILTEIKEKYGVPPEVLVAIWRIESNYGRNLGSFKVVEALATLAYKGRRRPFWRSQLIAALRIVEQGYAPLEKLVGSWAGAMGHTQFIPQTYLRWAVDHDGDGKRDLWSNIADVFASTANYLKESGWLAGQPWGLEVRLPKDFDWEFADPKVRKSVAAWQALGVMSADGSALPNAAGQGAILLPTGYQGPAFLVLPNYRAIERYNNSTSYALTVALLSDRFRGGGRVAAPWPVTSTPLSRDDKEELQRRLIAEGLDVGGVDGKVGPMTRKAIRGFQRKIKQPADGYASIELLKTLRGRQKASE